MKPMNFSIDELRGLLERAESSGLTTIDASQLLEPDIEGAVEDYSDSNESDKIDKLIMLLRTYQQFVLGGYSFEINPSNIGDDNIDILQDQYDFLRDNFLYKYRLNKLVQENGKLLIRKFLEGFFPKLTRKKKVVDVTPEVITPELPELPEVPSKPTTEEEYLEAPF